MKKNLKLMPETSTMPTRTEFLKHEKEGDFIIFPSSKTINEICSGLSGTWNERFDNCFSDFLKRIGGQESKEIIATDEMPATMLKIIKDGQPQLILNSLQIDPLKLCFTKEQIRYGKHHAYKSERTYHFLYNADNGLYMFTAWDDKCGHGAYWRKLAESNEDSLILPANDSDVSKSVPYLIVPSNAWD